MLIKQVSNVQYTDHAKKIQVKKDQYIDHAIIKSTNLTIKLIKTSK